MLTGRRSDFSETIIILVGPQEAKFTAHEAIICKDSRFFRALCSGQWAESTSRTARLPEDDPEVFQSYLQYTYARVFDAHTNWWEYDLVKLINIYVLADKLQNASLCNYTIDKLLSYYVAEHTWPSAYTASQVWNATPEKSPLRKLIVDYYCTMVPRHYFEQNYKKLPNDLILTMAFMSRPSTTASRNQYTAIKPGPNSKCQYHVHEAGEETCK